MTTLIKWGLPLLVCLITTVTSSAQRIAITSSQDYNSSHKMDETWQSIATAAGYTAEIHPTSFLSNDNLRSTSDLIIISSGTASIPADQFSNILQYVQAGGHIYIQSEYLVTFDGNKLYQYLVEQTGGAFVWGEQSDNNIGPVNIINGFENGLSNDQLDYFWYGTYGCGDAQVIPFLAVGGQNYAFYYRSSNPNIGNIMTNVDHDWIRTINNNKEERTALLANMLNILANGLANHDYIHPSITLPENINFCSDQNITAEVNQANAQDIQWYHNGQPTTMGAVLNISDFANGDSIYAEVTLPTGCLETTITSDTIIVLKDQTSPSINTSFSELAPICSGTMATIEITYDETLENIRHNWFLNGSDTPIKTDSYSSDELQDGDILEHGFTYFNGCEDIYLPTSGSITVRWNDASVTDFQITGQTAFCTATTTTLSLTDASIDNSTISWYVNDALTLEGEHNIDIAATETVKEVFATIKLYNDCTGWTTVTTSAVNVSVQSLAIALEEKADHDCTNGEGFIEVSSNNTDINYTWSNGQSGSYISNLSEGTYTVTATSSTGCTVTESYEINQIIFPLVKSVNVNQPNCNEGNGKVELDLEDNDLDYINVNWVDAEGQVISTDKQSTYLPAGTYQVFVNANGNCEETYDITIDGFFDDHQVTRDTVKVERGETFTLNPNMIGYEGYTVEWRSHADLSCTDCINPELVATVNYLFEYELVSAEGCRVKKAILVLVNIRDPYYAPSAFSPNNDGINEYYKIHTRSDVSPTSSLMIFDRWGSLIHEEESDTHGWDGKSFGRKIQKGTYVFVQNFEDTMGNQYMAKGSVTIFN